MPYQPTVPYADVNYADGYFADRLNADAWLLATSLSRAAALKQATRAIDILNFAGDKHDRTWAAAPTPPAPAPTLAPVGSGGTLAAGTYNVAVSFCYGTPTGNMVAPFDSGFESPLGAPTNVVVVLNGSITVSGSITLPAGATGYAVYAAGPLSASSAYKLQQFTAAAGGSTNSISLTITALSLLPFASAGNGQVLPCANQPNQFPRGDDTSVPDQVSQACCELALALLDDVDPNLEIEALQNTSQGIGDGRTTRDTSYVQEQTRAGIVSIQAWLLLVPFLRDTQHPTTRLTRSG